MTCEALLSGHVVLNCDVQLTLANASRLSEGKELCYLLFGAMVRDLHGRSLVRIHRVRRVANRARSRGRFVIARSALDEIVQSETLTLLGVFHSHSRTARPSPDDVRQMRRDGLYHLIGAPSDDSDCSLAAYHGTASGFVEVVLAGEADESS